MSPSPPCFHLQEILQVRISRVMYCSVLHVLISVSVCRLAGEITLTRGENVTQQRHARRHGAVNCRVRLTGYGTCRLLALEAC